MNFGILYRVMRYYPSEVEKFLRNQSPFLYKGILSEKEISYLCFTECYLKKALETIYLSEYCSGVTSFSAGEAAKKCMELSWKERGRGCQYVNTEKKVQIFAICPK